MTASERFLIGIAGPCGAGKTTLTEALDSLGYLTRHIAQEHSYVPDMWQRLTKPDILIYLDVSYQNTIARRKLNWTYQEYAEQLHRLRHARQHADLLIDTNPLTLQQVLNAVLLFIQSTNPESSTN